AQQRRLVLLDRHGDLPCPRGKWTLEALVGKAARAGAGSRLCLDAGSGPIDGSRLGPAFHLLPVLSGKGGPDAPRPSTTNPPGLAARAVPVRRHTTRVGPGGVAGAAVG